MLYFLFLNVLVEFFFFFVLIYTRISSSFSYILKRAAQSSWNTLKITLFITAENSKGEVQRVRERPRFMGREIKGSFLSSHFSRNNSNVRKKQRGTQWAWKESFGGWLRSTAFIISPGIKRKNAPVAQIDNMLLRKSLFVHLPPRRLTQKIKVIGDKVDLELFLPDLPSVPLG